MGTAELTDAQRACLLRAVREPLSKKIEELARLRVLEAQAIPGATAARQIEENEVTCLEGAIRSLWVGRGIRERSDPG